MTTQNTQTSQTQGSTPAPRSAARAIADVGAGLLLATVDIEVPPERVFRALCSEEVVHWWGSSEHYRTTRWTGDLKVGGAWRSEGVGSDGQPFSVSGEFLEIDPPKKLVQTWIAPWDGGNVTTLTYRLEPIGAGTRVTVRHEGFADRSESCRNHTQGWERVLGWLAGYLARGVASLGPSMPEARPGEPRPGDARTGERAGAGTAGKRHDARDTRDAQKN